MKKGGVGEVGSDGKGEGWERGRMGGVDIGME